MHRLALLFLVVAATLAAPAHAQRTLAHYVQACGLAGTSSSVVVDVYNAASPGSVLATIPNGSVSQIGSTDCYQVNLAAASGISYPAASDPAEKHYVLHFRDDAAGSVWTAETVSGFPAPPPVTGACERYTPVYASSPVPSRGVTQAVINVGKPSYAKVDVACDGEFSSPDFSYFEVFQYDATGRVLSRTPSATVPSP